RGVHRAHKIHLEDALPVAGFQVPEGKPELARPHPDRKDDMVAPSKACLYLFCRLPDTRVVRHIRDDAESVGTELPCNLFRDGIYIGAAVEQSNIRPLFRKRNGDSATDSMRRT